MKRTILEATHLTHRFSRRQLCTPVSVPIPPLQLWEISKQMEQCNTRLLELEDDTKEWAEDCASMQLRSERREQEKRSDIDTPFFEFVWHAQGKKRRWVFFRLPEWLTERVSDTKENEDVEEADEKDVVWDHITEEQDESNTYGQHLKWLLVPFLCWVLDWKRAQLQIQPNQLHIHPSELTTFRHKLNTLSADHFVQLCNLMKQHTTIEIFAQQLCQVQNHHHQSSDHIAIQEEFTLSKTLRPWEVLAIFRNLSGSYRATRGSWTYCVGIVQFIDDTVENKVRYAFQLQGLRALNFLQTVDLIDIMLKTGHFVPSSLVQHWSFFPHQFIEMDAVHIATEIFNSLG